MKQRAFKLGTVPEYVSPFYLGVFAADPDGISSLHRCRAYAPVFILNFSLGRMSEADGEDDACFRRRWPS